MAGEGEAPLVSVLIPCWNAEATIGAALGSVLAERSVPLECVVVDDASTDGTAAILADLATRDPRLVVVTLEANAGVSNARNVGLARVRGTWLTMLDADDQFTPGGLATLAAAATGDIRAVIGQQLVTDGRRQWLPSLYDNADVRRPGRRSLAGSPGLLNSVSPHAKLFHRSCFDGLRFSGRVLGDQPWIIRALIRAGDRIQVLGETVYLWHRPPTGVRTGSITSTTRASALRSVEAVEVAVGAVGAVAREADTLGTAARDTIVRAYVDRLFRADLGPMLVRALERRDPDTAALLEALRTFVERIPPADLTGGQAMARELLEPPLRRWHALDADGRSAYRRLASSARAADPSWVRRRPLLARLGLAIASRRDDHTRSVAHIVAAGILTLQWAIERVPRITRRLLGLMGRR